MSSLHARKAKMFRRVDLPARVSGRLLLHSMPGRYEAIESVWHQVRKEAVRAIVCLAEKDEIREKSFEYALALETGTVPCSVVPFEIPDRGAPEDQHAFWALAGDVAKRLQSGEAVLIHCAGGVGRSATLAFPCCSRWVNRRARRGGAVSRAGRVATAPQSQSFVVRVAIDQRAIVGPSRSILSVVSTTGPVQDVHASARPKIKFNHSK